MIPWSLGHVAVVWRKSGDRNLKKCCQPQSEIHCFGVRGQVFDQQRVCLSCVEGRCAKLAVRKRTMALQRGQDTESLPIPAKLYRIGELVNCTPFSRQTIHNYTIMGLIREQKWTAGGHRLYDESVFERLSEILRLRKTKTLSQIREIMGKRERHS